MSDSITGADDLGRVSKALKDVGDGELRKRTLAGIRNQGKPTIADIRANALGSLPAGGGFAAIVAKTPIGVRTRLSPTTAGVTIRVTGKGDREGLDRRGRLRKPLFGNRSLWYTQNVRPGWFSEPVEENAPEFRRGIEQVLTDIKQEIERRV